MHEAVTGKHIQGWGPGSGAGKELRSHEMLGIEKLDYTLILTEQGIKKGLGGERKILISNQQINKLGPCWLAASVALAPLLGEGRRPKSNKSNLASRYVVNAELLDYIIDQQERPINQYGYETRSAHQYRCSEGFLN